MGFWDTWHAAGEGIRNQKAYDQGYVDGINKGRVDMTKWCANLQQIILEETAGSVGQRVVLDKALEELRKLDPTNWMLVKDNRIRMASKVGEEAFKHADRGIAVPSGWVYIRQPNGFLERREFNRQENEVVGVVRKPGQTATAMTMEEVGLAPPD